MRSTTKAKDSISTGEYTGHVFPLGVVYTGGPAQMPHNPPTQTRPGTRDRIEVYRQRAESGLPIFVEGDYVDPEFYSRGRISFDPAPTACVQKMESRE